MQSSATNEQKVKEIKVKEIKANLWVFGESGGENFLKIGSSTLLRYPVG